VDYWCEVPKEEARSGTMTVEPCFGLWFDGCSVVHAKNPVFFKLAETATSN